MTFITAPIKGDITFEDNEGFADLPTLPETLGTPEVQWGFDGETLDTQVTLTLDGVKETVTFWGKDPGNISNTTQGAPGNEGHTPWENLAPADFDTAINWATTVHQRLQSAIVNLTESAAPRGSEAYAAILAFATDDEVNPGYAKTAKERALERAADALKPYVTFADDELERPGRFRDLLTDLLHAADEQGVDFDAALENARRGYAEDLASRGFAEDLL
jgi:hypothetical protein